MIFLIGMIPLAIYIFVVSVWLLLDESVNDYSKTGAMVFILYLALLLIAEGIW
jgi:hypothetical protein